MERIDLNYFLKKYTSERTNTKVVQEPDGHGGFTNVTKVVLPDGEFALVAAILLMIEEIRRK